MPKTKSYTNISQSGCSTIAEKLSSAAQIVKTTASTVNNSLIYHYRQASQCSINFTSWHSIIYILTYYILVNILPFIVVITTIIYFVEIINDFIKYRQADFYEDVIKYKEAVDISQIPFAGFYISQHILTFFIILIIYVVAVITTFIIIKYINDINSNCAYYYSKWINNAFFIFLYFVIILVTVILDLSMYSKFYKIVGSNIEQFNNIISKHINNPEINSYIEYLTGINENLIAANTTDNLKTHVNTLISEIQKVHSFEKHNVTDDDLIKIKETQHYKNIINAYLTYGILNTIRDNGYYSKKYKTINKDFLKPKNIFLSINKSINRLINISYTSDLEDFIRSETKHTKTLLSHVFQECDLISNNLKDIIASIKNSADNTTTSKAVSMCLLIPLIVATIIYTFVG